MTQELIHAPAFVYRAPIGTVVPEISLPPPAAWVSIGLRGSKSYEESGVVVRTDQEISEQMVLGSTVAQKPFRNSELLEVDVPLLDMTAETLAFLYNNHTVTTRAAAAGVGGQRSFPIMRGPATVHQFAVLVRFESPYDNSLLGQLWAPQLYVMSIGEMTWQKTAAVMSAVTLKATEHETDGLGMWMFQDEAAP